MGEVRRCSRRSWARIVPTSCLVETDHEVLSLGKVRSLTTPLRITGSRRVLCYCIPLECFWRVLFGGSLGRMWLGKCGSGGRGRSVGRFWSSMGGTSTPAERKKERKKERQKE